MAAINWILGSVLLLALYHSATLAKASPHPRDENALRRNKRHDWQTPSPQCQDEPICQFTSQKCHLPVVRKSCPKTCGGWITQTTQKPSSELASELSEGLLEFASELSKFSPEFASTLSEYAPEYASELSRFSPELASLLSRKSVELASRMRKSSPKLTSELSKFSQEFLSQVPPKKRIYVIFFGLVIIF